jgi:hypothetical protein
MKTFSEDCSKGDKLIKADHQFNDDQHPIDVRGKVKKEVKELGKSLHHFIVDWQNSEVIIPKI